MFTSERLPPRRRRRFYFVPLRRFQRQNERRKRDTKQKYIPFPIQKPHKIDCKIFHSKHVDGC